MSLSDAFDRPAIKASSKPSSWSGPSLGSKERDFAENGWPSETVAKILADGAAHGRGSAHWASAKDPEAPQLLIASLPSASGSIVLILDPSSRVAAVRGPGGLSAEGSDFEALATRVAIHSHRSAEPLRAQDPVAQRAGMWQSNASIALARAVMPESGFHPHPGADASSAWEADFDRIDDFCQAGKHPVEALARIRSAYQGSSEKDMRERMSQAIASKAARADIDGEPAALVSLGAKGCEIRAAIPLRADGSVRENAPIMALLGRPAPDGSFERSGEPLRFYNAEAFAHFAASATRQEIAQEPLPFLDAHSKLGARRAAQSPAEPSAGVGLKA